MKEATVRKAEGVLRAAFDADMVAAMVARLRGPAPSREDVRAAAERIAKAERDAEKEKRKAEAAERKAELLTPTGERKSRAERAVGAILTGREVAELFGVTPYTVKEWRKSGRLRGCKPAGTRRWRFRARDVEAFLASGGGEA